MIPATTNPHRPKPSAVAPSETHLFALGQAVRLRGALATSGIIYLITAKLPPIGDSPQYRVRNEAEKFEWVATQSNLEPVHPSTDGATLMEKSFGVG